MKAYKLLEDQVGPLKEHLGKNRIFCRFENLTILLATYTKPHLFFGRFTLNKLIDKNLVEEINLEDEKWIFPHLYKPLRQALLANN